MIKHKKQA